jgi:hypothetical protein
LRVERSVVEAKHEEINETIAVFKDEIAVEARVDQTIKAYAAAVQLRQLNGDISTLVVLS